MSNNRNKIAIFETSMGTFKAELYCSEMPITTGNFIDLVHHGFYNQLYFHRVIPNFMNQFGCPNTKNDPYTQSAGTGGPDPNTTFVSSIDPTKTYQRNEDGGIPDELTCRISNTSGTLSMANTGAPESGGSQFFINVAGTFFFSWFVWMNIISSKLVWCGIVIVLLRTHYNKRCIIPFCKIYR
jgi:cyclophilin family peptidyl-prolyl cis-trans isomerase